MSLGDTTASWVHDLLLKKIASPSAALSSAEVRPRTLRAISAFHRGFSLRPALKGIIPMPTDRRPN